MFVNISKNELVIWMLYKKKPVFSIENPGPALDLIHILPTLTFTFRQTTNRGLNIFSFKILSHPKSCVYFQSISQKDTLYLILHRTIHSNLFNFTLL